MVHPRWCRSCFINSRARKVHHLCFCADVCDMGNVYIRRHNVCSAHSVAFTQKNVSQHNNILQTPFATETFA